MPVVTPVRDPLLGAVLDRRYRIDALIARGGMSSVYVGVDLRLDRPVAVKVMDPRYSSDPQFLSRLEFEARAVARLKDPGLVPVYDQGIDGEFAFLVMELVEGGTLRELLRERGPMPPHAVAAVLGPALGGLAQAHHAGLVHRDIKPENVLISDAGEVKVVDFGLVRAIAAAGITSHSVILGTAAYLSPEQVEFAAADARSDVYSAGIMAFEMITGRTPFDGDTPLGLAYARLNSDVPAPGEFIDGVPAEFDELVLTATARDPAHRFADAAQMQAALTDIATRLELPRFTVPAPLRSAERASAERVRHSMAAGGVADDSARGPNTADPPEAPRTATRVQTVPPVFDSTVLPPAPAPGYADPELAGRDPAGERFGTAVMPDPAAFAARPTLAAAAQDYPARRTRSRRRVLALLVAVLVLAGALAGVGWWLGEGRFTQIPDIAGMNRTAAHHALSEAGFRVVDKPRYDDTVARDTALSTSPQVGSRATRSSSVTLNYSAGRPEVPQIAPGTSLSAATAQLADRTLTVTVGDRQFSRYPADSVISLSPAAGTVVATDSAITVTVSSGPATSVPDVTGMSEDKARDTLIAVGLTPVDAGSTADGDAAAGTIAKTEPAASSTLDSGDTTVRLYVSDAVTVPSVMGKSVSSARDALEQAGLRVKVRSLTHSSRAIVIYQSVSAGDRVSPGTQIEIGSLP